MSQLGPQKKKVATTCNPQILVIQAIFICLLVILLKWHSFQVIHLPVELFKYVTAGSEINGHLTAKDNYFSLITRSSKMVVQLMIWFFLKYISFLSDGFHDNLAFSQGKIFFCFKSER